MFEQPSARFTSDIKDSEPKFSGRMGHSLVQLGEAVISFGGCSFGRVCSSELLIQKPTIVEANMLYDCKNSGKIN